MYSEGAQATRNLTVDARCSHLSLIYMGILWGYAKLPRGTAVSSRNGLSQGSSGDELVTLITHNLNLLMSWTFPKRLNNSLYCIIILLHLETLSCFTLKYIFTFGLLYMQCLILMARDLVYPHQACIVSVHMHRCIRIPHSSLLRSPCITHRKMIYQVTTSTPI